MDPSGSFTLRDFLQYVLPALLAGCMYAPLVTPDHRVSPEGIIFGAVILSYIVWWPVYRLAQRFYEIFPLTARRTKEAFKVSKVTLGKWNQDKLRYLLTSDEKEYLYSHGSFASLYAVAGLHLFVYAGINLFILGRAGYSALAATPAGGASDAPRRSVVTEVGRRILSASTPSIADFQVNTLSLLIASTVLFYFAYKQYMLYYELLFNEGGQYDQLAQKYLKTNESVARSVGEQVKVDEGEEKRRLFLNATVTLKKNDGTVVGSVKVDAQRRFQFTDIVLDWWVAEGEVAAERTETEAKENLAGTVIIQGFRLSKEQVPRIDILIPKPKETPSPTKAKPSP